MNSPVDPFFFKQTERPNPFSVANLRPSHTNKLNKMRGLKQMLEFVMNMDYKLQPIADQSDTMTLARVAFAHFFTQSVTDLCFGKHCFEYHCLFIHGLSWSRGSLGSRSIRCVSLSLRFHVPSF